jgi:hypothetical protein
MSDFDFNLNFVSNKASHKPPVNKTDTNDDNPGKSLESKYIDNNGKTNQIIPIPKSTLALLNLKTTKIADIDSSIVSEKKSGKFDPFKKLNFRDRFRLPSFKFAKRWKFAAIIGVFAILLGLILSSIFSNKITNSAQGGVAGVSEKIKPKKVGKDTTDAYKSWIGDKLGSYNEPNDDFDVDQLTNEEEFIIGSEPNNPNTCNPKKTDAENLVEFINPVTCKSIDLSDSTAMEKFKKVIDFNTVRSKVMQLEAKNTKDEPQTNTSGSVLALFGVSSLENLNKQEFNSSKFKSELDLIKVKQESIDKINRINQYMKETRSLEPFDRNYPIPVNGAVYLEVSLKYNVPLKYTLAVAQRESRFGTDAYNKEGNLTRPGKYKNIFSMGLDDEGNNVGFETWEKGVESFGRWYKRFNDKGVSDCSKWRIYNPNGDYCKSIEETASQIETYLNK